MHSRNISVPLPLVVLGTCTLFLSLSVHLFEILSSQPYSLPILTDTDVEAAEINASTTSDNLMEEVGLLIELPEVALVTERSENFGLNSTFDAQWLNLTPKQTMGFVFHPKAQKFYSVAFYHQIHCLNALRRYIAEGRSTCSSHSRCTC